MITNIQTPAARRHDPETSHLAAAEVTRSGKRQTHIRMLAELLEVYAGHTSAELAFMVADKHPELNRHEVARRLADGKGVVFIQGPKKMCSATHRMCMTWFLKPAKAVQQ